MDLVHVVDAVQEQIASLSITDHWLLSDIRDDFRRLSSTMDQIRAVLHDAERRRVNDPYIQDWLNKLEDALEDAYDLVAEFDAETLRRSGDSSIEMVRNVFSSHTQIVFNLKMSRKISKLCQRLDQIAEERYASAFGLRHAELEETPARLTRRPETDSFVRVEDIIGREEDKQKIVKWLLDDNVDIHSKEFDVDVVIPVLPIVGMGGLGKTALAQLIINDERVRDHFELRSWVHVGVNFGLRQILCKLLRQIDDSDPGYLGMGVLSHQFREITLGKRCLFVLDDLWSVDHNEWQKLKCLLASGAQEGSWVIVTTQIQNFAGITSTEVPYHLGRLGEGESRSLFQRMAFRDGYDPRDSRITENVKIRIMRKCGGNPLAIKTIGRILYCGNPQEWDSFSNMELPNVVELVRGGIIETLGLRIAVLQNCLSLGTGARKDLGHLNSQLRAIKFLLLEAAKTTIHSELVCAQLDRIEEILHEADDLLAELHGETLQGSTMVGSKINKMIPNVLSTQLVFSRKVRHKIRNIHESLAEMLVDARMFHLSELQQETPAPLTRRPETDSLVRVEDIIGREEDIEKMVKWLLDDDVHIHSEEFDVDVVIPVLPIVGMGGLGKTALAQLIINDERVRDHFELRSWVHLGVNVDLRQILCKLLRQISDSDLENLDMDALINRFRERILGKRYLFVLDDLWSVNHKNWQELKDLLKYGAQEGSRVIVTTQIQKSAEIICTEVPYLLGRLSEEASWSLFQRMAFRDGREPSDSGITENVKMRILRRCGGSPLAIMTIGRILYCRNPREWDSFSNRELPNVVELGGGGIIETLRLRIVLLETCLLLGTDARKELRELNSQLRTVKVELLEVTKTTIHSDQVQVWLNGMEEILHCADNLLAELHGETLQGSTMVGSKINKRVPNVFSTQLASSRMVCLRIKNIHESLYEMLMYKKRFHLMVLTEETPVPLTRRPETDSFARQEDIIGREEDKEKIVKWLLNDVDPKKDVVPVLPIVGMGGLGKTALAQLVFNDEMVRDHFELRSWIHVGDNVEVRQVLLQLLRQITDSGSQNVEMEVLINQFRERILGKRYLFVLDDLRYVDHRKWQDLTDLLTSAAEEASRVIVTTRIQNDAGVTSTAPPYHLDPLGEDASWSLFQRMAFRDRREPHDSGITKNEKMRIMRKCGGNPLAIRTIGRMLYYRNPQEWESFLLENEASSGVQYDGDGGIIETLKLSYNELPSHLRKCFAFCRLFPKGYEIDVRMLVSLWISQGFIRGNDPEQIGYVYFKDLLQRSFFQGPKTDELGNITRCKMQNLMHDLATSITETRYVTYGSTSEENKCSKKTHHVSFGFHLDSPWQIPTDLVQVKAIRSIILTRQSQWEIKGVSGDSICDVIASKFKLLRMLDLHNSGIKVVPASIGELKLLKYLDLSQNKDIEALPRSFCRLLNLHTLKLNGCGRLQELPRKIRKLINLRRLEIDSCYSLTHMPRGLGQLTNLRTLSEFVLSTANGSASRHVGELDELVKLNKLKGQLKIKNLRPGRNASTVRPKKGKDADVPAVVLKQKTHLRSVMLIWDTSASLDNDATIKAAEDSLDGLEPHSSLEEMSISAYGGIRFSEWLSSHENLVKLSLSKCMNCKYLPLLNRLTKLKVLVVDEMANLEYISDNIVDPPTAAYPSLKELRLTNCPKLVRWWKVAIGVEETTFPCLSKLIIEDCPCLNSMPLFPHLEELLLLKNTSWEPFQHTIRRKQIPSHKTAAEASSSTSSAHPNMDHPLSKLRTLSLIQMSDGDTDMWQYLRSLRSLTFDHLSNVETLLERLPQVTTLQELHISRCDGLSRITPWISNLQSLRKLSIRLCPSLTIPLEQSIATSLQNVEIEDCPKIVELEKLLNTRGLRR